MIAALPRIAYYQGFVIGAICCRIEPGEGGRKKLYIMTLGVLAAYRKRGIGERARQREAFNRRVDLPTHGVR